MRVWVDFGSSPGGFGARKLWFCFNETYDFEKRALWFPEAFPGHFRTPNHANMRSKMTSKIDLDFGRNMGRLEKVDVWSFKEIAKSDTAIPV